MIKISARRMYGFEKIKIKDTEVVVSDKERTLVDMLYFSGPVGGLKRASDILKEQAKDREIDVSKLIDYAVGFPNVSSRKRIGFAIIFLVAEALNFSATNSFNTRQFTEPASKRGSLVKGWRNL
ncbi:unnamed protein product [marine sediment metagenome]|uniref:Uncharacterized protein n=1 Tax=marine sediment metagenome TaxID=412755 RepID=X1GTI5_9ZZZZ